MADKDEPTARVFSVETRFQKLARRPGGISRDQALENAAQKIEAIRPSFDDWLTSELEPLSAAINGAKVGTPAADWLETANLHSAQIRDAGTTMGSELITFIAGSLCEVLDAVAAGAECNMDSIVCHLDALFLARQRQFRGMKPEQVPELTRGLRRVVQVVNTTPN
jgi:hypothetical protein